MQFFIPKEDEKEIQSWVKSHDCKLGIDEFGQKKVGAIGGELTFSFTPTGLGPIITVTCACGEELDLTHSEDW